MWGTLESQVFPITAKCQNELDAVILYNDPTVNSEKIHYPHSDIDGRRSGRIASGICENAYKRIARLGILQGTRRYAQIGDALTHLTVRANCYLRPCNFLDEKFDDPYELFSGDEENGIPPTSRKTTRTEDGSPFTVTRQAESAFPPRAFTASSSARPMLSRGLSRWMMVW